MRSNSTKNSKEESFVVRRTRSRNKRNGLPMIIIIMTFLMPFSVALADTLSLDLGQAMHMALKNNRDLVIAQHKLEEAAAGVRSARTNFLPKLKARATYTRLDEIPYLDASAFGSIFEPLQAPFEDLVNNGYLDPATLAGLSGTGDPGKIYVGDDDNYDINLSLQQPIFTGFMLINNLKISNYQRSSVEFLGQRTKERVRQQVTQAYWDLLSTREFVNVTEEAIRQLESHVTDLKNLLEVGMVIENDLLRAELALSNVRLRDVKVRNGVRLANAALCNLLIVDQNTAIVPTEKITVDEVVLPSLDTLFRVAMAKRPDYLALDYNVKILGKVKAIKKAAYLPQIVLVANYDWKRPDREYQPEFYSTWNINLIATLDVFSWAQRHFEIQKVEAQRKQLSELQTQLADYITLEVRQAYLSVQEAREEVDISTLAVNQAEENYRVTSANYQAGVVTNSDLLDAQTALTQAKIASIQAKANLKKAIVNLQTATSENKE